MVASPEGAEDTGASTLSGCWLPCPECSRPLAVARKIMDRVVARHAGVGLPLGMEEEEGGG